MVPGNLVGKLKRIDVVGGNHGEVSALTPRTRGSAQDVQDRSDVRFGKFLGDRTEFSRGDEWAGGAVVDQRNHVRRAREIARKNRCGIGVVLDVAVEREPRLIHEVAGYDRGQLQLADVVLIESIDRRARIADRSVDEAVECLRLGVFTEQELLRQSVLARDYIIGVREVLVFVRRDRLRNR